MRRPSLAIPLLLAMMALTGHCVDNPDTSGSEHQQNYSRNYSDNEHEGNDEEEEVQLTQAEMGEIFVRYDKDNNGLLTKGELLDRISEDIDDEDNEEFFYKILDSFFMMHDPDDNGLTLQEFIKANEEEENYDGNQESVEREELRQ
jgi:Ca2+-binding EF-hand superfamily protein